MNQSLVKLNEILNQSPALSDDFKKSVIAWATNACKTSYERGVKVGRESNPKS